MKETQAFRLVKRELAKARAKFPKFNSPHEGHSVIEEEFDELWADIKANNPPEIQTPEAVQVAAMAIRFLIDLC